MTTKEKILSAALTLFNEQGTDVITVRHIAQAVGISHGNLCYHFPNTDAMVSSLYEQLVARINSQIAEVMQTGFDLTVSARLADQTMAALYDYRFLMLDFAGIMRRIPTVREQHRALIGQRNVVLQQILAYLRSEGMMKPPFYPDYDDHLLTQLFIVGDFWIASAEWLYDGQPADKLPYYQQVLTALIVPLLTEKGMALWQARMSTTG